MKMLKGLVISTLVVFSSCTLENESLRPRMLDMYAKDYMVEDINGVSVVNKAAPACGGGFRGLGWVYFDGHCYMFTSQHTPFANAKNTCNKKGAYMAEIYSKEESDFIHGVLDAINPKDGTDYFLGGVDATNSKEIIWQSGHNMTFKDFVNGEPKGKMFLHMNYDLDFRWDTKNQDDKDNGFICKRKL